MIGKMRWLTALLMITALVMAFAAGSASADGSDLSEVRQFERVTRELELAEKGLKLGAARIGNASVHLAYGATLKCIRMPVLDGYGAWSVTYDPNLGVPSKMSIYLMMKDWSSDYTTVYKQEYNSFQSTVSSSYIVSGGQYKFMVYLYYDSVGGYYADSYTFSISDDASHTSLTEKIASVVSSQRASTQWQTALNLHDWLIKNAYYDKTYSYYGADMILRGYGVCDGYSKAYYMLCKAAGIDVRKIEGNTGEGLHAWNAIKLDGKWYYVDPTWDDPSGSTSKVSGKEGHGYFCLNEELMRIDHSSFEWSGGSKGSCTSLDANYYVYRGDWNGIGNRVKDSSGNMTTYSAQIAAQIANNLGGNYVSWGDFFYITDNSGWYVSEWNSTMERSWKLLAYAMSQKPMSVSGFGTINLTVYYSKDYNCFIYKIHGFNVKETGTLKLPAKTKTIDSESFLKTKASTVIVPSGCTSIGANAFANSGVHRIEIPDTVTSIDSTAFAGCSQVLIVCNGGSAAANFGKQNNILWTYP